MVDNGIEFDVCFKPCFTDLDGYGVLLGDVAAIADDPGGPALVSSMDMVMSTVAPKLPPRKKQQSDLPIPVGAVLDGPADDDDDGLGDGAADADYVRSLLDEVVYKVVVAMGHTATRQSARK